MLDIYVYFVNRHTGNYNSIQKALKRSFTCMCCFECLECSVILQTTCLQVSESLWPCCFCCLYWRTLLYFIKGMIRKHTNGTTCTIAPTHELTHTCMSKSISTITKAFLLNFRKYHRKKLRLQRQAQQQRLTTFEMRDFRTRDHNKSTWEEACGSCSGGASASPSGGSGYCRDSCRRESVYDKISDVTRDERYSASCVPPPYDGNNN